MKYSETPSELVASRINYINNRWGQLSSLSKDYSEHALRFLFLANSGGAVATLSFLGASQDVRLLLAPKISLALFLLGIIITGVLYASFVHRVDNIYQEWRKNVNCYYQDEICWSELNANDDSISWGNKKEYILGWSAFACFSIGGISGLVQFICG